jgi:hypothetical protein
MKKIIKSADIKKMMKEFDVDEFWMEDVAMAVNLRMFDSNRTFFYWSQNTIKEQSTAYRVVIFYLARASKSTRLDEVAGKIADIFGVGSEAITTYLKGMQNEAIFKGKLYVADQFGQNFIEAK